MNRYLDISCEVKEALASGKPVVALESTIISHGMPYPQNVETALQVEKIIRENGAVPATIAIIGGRLKAGLTPEEIDYLGKTGTAVAKASRRDLPQGQDFLQLSFRARCPSSGPEKVCRCFWHACAPASEICLCRQVLFCRCRL